VGDRRKECAAVLIYDGACPLCRRSLAWVRRMDWMGRIETLSLAMDKEVARRYPRLEHADLLLEMHVVGAGGRVWRGFYAFRRLACILPPLWPLLPLLYLPGVPALGRAVYAWVAASRRRDGETCDAHTGPGPG